MPRQEWSEKTPTAISRKRRLESCYCLSGAPPRECDPGPDPARLLPAGVSITRDLRTRTICSPGSSAKVLSIASVPAPRSSSDARPAGTVSSATNLVRKSPPTAGRARRNRNRHCMRAVPLPPAWFYSCATIRLRGDGGVGGSGRARRKTRVSGARLERGPPPLNLPRALMLFVSPPFLREAAGRLLARLRQRSAV